MIGKYKMDTKIQYLPKYNDTEETCHPKLLSPYNASYIDNFFNYLSSQLLHTHNHINGLDYYGSFLGIQDNFKMDITDDLEYLHDSTYFNRNVGDLFHIESNIDFEMISSKCNETTQSRNHRNRIVLDDDIPSIYLEMETIEEESSSYSNIVESELEEIQFEDVWNRDSLQLDSLCSTNSSNSLVNYSSEEEDQDEDEEGEDEESYSSMTSDDDIDATAYINNFPVQMICLEKCDGTMDQLFEEGQINAETAASALMQIIMTLLIYQKTFHFTHNDLHTNNIMFVRTKEKYIFYQFEKKWYKVPTHGKIFKIIDFGRSIYQFRGRRFCSDSFAACGDAATQYNTEPFLVEGKPRLEPNFGFDLCRLGCSIYDFIIDGEKKEEMDEFQKTILRWCTDDNGKNMLYMKNGKERYPNFKLYKMIARTCHYHTPSAQLSFPFFQQFLVPTPKPANLKSNPVIYLDEMHCYVHL
jgi:hypothetical protein